MLNSITNVTSCHQQTESRELWIPIDLPDECLDGNVTSMSVCGCGWHPLACKCIRKQQQQQQQQCLFYRWLQVATNLNNGMNYGHQ